LRKNGKILFGLLLIGMLLAWPIGFLLSKMEKPAGQEQLVELDKLAEELLTQTKKGDMESAQRQIKKLAEKFPKQTLPLEIRIESLHAVTQSILNAQKAFDSAKGEESKLLWHATQVRVAIDALRHAERPMWRDYYSSYATQMQNLLQSAVERDAVQFRAQFDENHRLFLAIKPAMSIQLSEQQMNQIEAAYELVSKEIRKESIEWQTVREALRELSGIMQTAFIGEDKSALALLMRPGSPLTLIASVSAAVILTLAYVAWKKYAAEQAKTV
jgi:sporulation protein YpjB